MTERWVLDTGPLGRLAYPRANKSTTDWVRRLRGSGVLLFIPEIADYELRREFIRARLSASLRRLDRMKLELDYVPIETATMIRAAEFWAEARNSGRPAADPKELDADVILAAQAESVGATVVTENAGHLELFVPVKHWRELAPPS